MKVLGTLAITGVFVAAVVHDAGLTVQLDIMTPRVERIIQLLMMGNEPGIWSEPLK